LRGDVVGRASHITVASNARLRRLPPVIRRVPYHHIQRWWNNDTQSNRSVPRLAIALAVIAERISRWLPCGKPNSMGSRNFAIAAKSESTLSGFAYLRDRIPLGASPNTGVVPS